MEDQGRKGGEIVTIWKLDDPFVLKEEMKHREEAKRLKLEAKAEVERKAAEREVSPTSLSLFSSRHPVSCLYLYIHVD
jgi:hypothetical protein